MGAISRILGVGRFVVISFIFMGWAFYQLSGGSSFDPAETRASRIDAPSTVETAVLQTAVIENDQPAAQPIELELATVQEVLTPLPRLSTTSARIQAPARTPLAEQEQATLELEVEETPQIILPSLIEGAVPSEGSVTPVDFSNDTAAAVSTFNPERRVVSGNRVNVRGGPGTNFQVVNRLVRGDEVEVLEDPGNGWVRLRPVGGGTVGWMADFLLSEG